MRYERLPLESRHETTKLAVGGFREKGIGGQMGGPELCPKQWEQCSICSGMYDIQSGTKGPVWACTHVRAPGGGW